MAKNANDMNAETRAEVRVIFALILLENRIGCLILGIVFFSGIGEPNQRGTARIIAISKCVGIGSSGLKPGLQPAVGSNNNLMVCNQNGDGQRGNCTGRNEQP